MSQENTEIIVAIATVCAHYTSAAGGNLLMGAGVTAINRYHRYTKKLISYGVVSLAIGLALPILIVQCAKINELAGGIIGLIVCLPLVLVSIWCLFLPIHIAEYRKHAHLKSIIALNLLVLVPFSWLLALWWATQPEKKLIANPAEYFSPAALVICERADKAVSMLRDAGLSKAAERLRLALPKNVAGDKLLLRLDQVLDRLMFDFELPDAIADELRSLSEDIHAAE